MNDQNNVVRVRFAPSPTGFFHIGSARTALFNWLYAKHCEGKFILRIEDTDEERDTPEALRVLIEGMRWLGMTWDEGPGIGGPYAPYFQSQRGDIYKSYLQKLFTEDRAYEKDGAIYFRVTGKPAVIHDAIRGDVTRLEEKDFVIFRSNGTPVFHFVNVVDDVEMKITHVIRGEDHLSNSSKHVELFQAFGVPVPVFAHIPLILKTVGSGKMSKRDQGALIEDYQRHGYLPEAVRNYLCLLGWSPKDYREILPIEEIIALFDLPQINKNNARFDEKKLAFMNTEYLRHLPLEAFVAHCIPIMKNADLLNAELAPEQLQRILAICQEKVRSLEDLPTFCGYFFSEDFAFNEEAWAKIARNGNSSLRIRDFLNGLRFLEDVNETSLEKMIQRLALESGVNSGEFIHSVRFAVSGQSVGPGFYKLLEVLGREKVMGRLSRFLAANQ